MNTANFKEILYNLLIILVIASIICYFVNLRCIDIPQNSFLEPFTESPREKMRRENREKETEENLKRSQMTPEARKVYDAAKKTKLTDAFKRFISDPITLGPKWQ